MSANSFVRNPGESDAKTRRNSRTEWKIHARNTSGVPSGPWRQPVGPAYISSSTDFQPQVSPHSRTSAALYGNSSTGIYSGQQLQPAVTSNPGSTNISASPIAGGINASICIHPHQLEFCYAYALDRGNGVYTRLIPADRLPPMRGLLQTQGAEGLIILPPPRASSLDHNGAILDNWYQPAPSVIGEGRPSSSPPAKDPIQSKIDTIIATSSAPVPSLTSPSVVPSKKQKVYCDKWLHDGTCAFTQQGCRYKHEMPLDRPTQIEVGLFNGLPGWYRRQQAAELRSGSPSQNIPGSRLTERPRGSRGTFAHAASWRGSALRGRLEGGGPSVGSPGAKSVLPVGESPDLFFASPENAKSSQSALTRNVTSSSSPAFITGPSKTYGPADGKIGGSAANASASQNPFDVLFGYRDERDSPPGS